MSSRLISGEIVGRWPLEHDNHHEGRSPRSRSSEALPSLPAVWCGSVSRRVGSGDSCRLCWVGDGKWVQAGSGTKFLLSLAYLQHAEELCAWKYQPSVELRNLPGVGMAGRWGECRNHHTVPGQSPLRTSCITLIMSVLWLKTGQWQFTQEGGDIADWLTGFLKWMAKENHLNVS